MLGGSSSRTLSPSARSETSAESFPSDRSRQNGASAPPKFPEPPFFSKENFRRLFEERKFAGGAVAIFEQLKLDQAIHLPVLYTASGEDMFNKISAALTHLKHVYVTNASRDKQMKTAGRGLETYRKKFCTAEHRAQFVEWYERDWNTLSAGKRLVVNRVEQESTLEETRLKRKIDPASPVTSKRARLSDDEWWSGLEGDSDTEVDINLQVDSKVEVELNSENCEALESKRPTADKRTTGEGGKFSFLKRYKVVCAIPHCPFSDFGERHHGEEYAKYVDAYDKIAEAESVDLSHHWEDSTYLAVMRKLKLMDIRVDDVSDNYKGKGRSARSLPRAPKAAENESPSSLRAAFLECFDAGFDDPEIGELVVAAHHCMRYFTTPRLRNTLISPEIRELAYRSKVLDRLFESIFSSDHITYSCGEEPNGLIARARTSQNNYEAQASGPLHDGIAFLDFPNSESMPVLFIEVVGGPVVRDRVKVRTDTEKLLKAIAMSIEVQVGIAQAGDAEDDVLATILAVGILVDGRKIQILVGRSVEDQVVICEAAAGELPIDMQHWERLGGLLKELILVKVRSHLDRMKRMRNTAAKPPWQYRLGYLYTALAPYINCHKPQPKSVIPVTPGKGLKSRSKEKGSD
ncbi:hypothetical protein HDV00_007115 [Rhizophlyctis rosea]|nr:hypothetical protein HDV00_007115 [Rhizophlyctis rosea]